MLVLSVLVNVMSPILAVFAQQTSFSFENSITIGAEWQVLGPFQSGTREQQWGADPLEAFGGFRQIKYNETKSFPSLLNGTVHFTVTRASPVAVKNDIVSRKIPVSFPYVNWEMLETMFGWSALQFQAWIRGSLHIHREGRYGLWIGNAVEFYLDGTYYDVGNLYDTDIVQFSRGGLFLELSPGEHVLEIRVVNDIRAFGGHVPPKVEIEIALRKVIEDLVVADYDSHGGWVVPTVINVMGRDGIGACLAGEFASFALRNEGPNWIVITGLRVNQVSPVQCN
jgi:hypothetical protein